MSEIPKRKAYVLWFRYTDGSAASVERVYLDKQRAEEDFKIAEQYSHGSWQLAEVPIFGPAS